MIGPHIIRVFGTPKAQPRPRMTSSGHAYNPPSADAWKEQIELFCRTSKVKDLKGPVGVETIFYMPIPKAMKKNPQKYHTHKPDIDNLLKAVFDAMTNADVWDDDKQICWIHARKEYENEKQKPGVEILVWEKKE